MAGALVTAGAFGVTGDSCWCCCCHWCHHQEHQNGRFFCHVQGHLGHGYHCCGGDTEVYVVSWGHRCLHCLQGCWVCGHCSHCWGWGTAVVGTATVRGTGLWAPLPLLPCSLWLWVPLQLGSQSCVHHLPYCYQVLWGVDLAVMARGLRLQAPPSLFPWFCCLCMFQSTKLQIYKCVDLSSILVC